MTTNRYVQALVEVLRSRPAALAAAEPAALPAAPADLELLVGALAATRPPVGLGQWELAVGGLEHARRLLDGLEPSDGDDEVDAMPAADHVAIVANSAGGLVVVLGWGGDARTRGVWVIDEAHLELVRRYRDLGDWIGAAVFDPAEEAYDRQGLIATIKARLRT